ncbi:carbonic anhydrase [Candidatus Omnitrophota bacterium]
MTQKRTVCLNCIDGRVQLPVIQWIKDSFDSDHVDMITEPGVDGFLSDGNNPIDDIARKVGISIEKNAASVIFIVGHHDCKGNPATESVHKDHILQAVDRLKKEFPEMDVVGLWVNSQWEVERL